MIPLVDLTKQYGLLRPKIDQALKRVMSQGDFVLGKEVELFEKEFATFCTTRYSVGVASGTDAILLALRALNIKKGDEVIVPANTFISTVLPIIYLGAKPVLVDINPETYTIDTRLVKRIITKKTRAIIPVHLYGQMAEMDSILRLAKQHHLFVIEDACQAHGAMYKGKMAGSFGDIGCFSFYPGKNLGAYGDGGAITTNSNILADHIRILRNIGQTKKYHHTLLGYNSRLDTLQAAILRVKLIYLDRWNAKRRSHAELYDKLLSEIHISGQKILNGHTSNHHLYVVRVKRRNALISFLKTKGIQCGIHYPIPLHLQKSLNFLGYKKGDFPIAEQSAREIISLPMFPELTRQEIHSVVAQIRTFYYHS